MSIRTGSVWNVNLLVVVRKGMTRSVLVTSYLSRGRYEGVTGLLVVLFIARNIRRIAMHMLR